MSTTSPITPNEGLAEAAQPAAVPGASPMRSVSTKRQIRGSSLLLFGGIISKGLNFLIQVLIVRYLAKSEYGAFAYALSIETLGSAICAFGLNQSITRFIPIYHEREDYSKMAGTIFIMLATVLSLGIGTIVLFYALHDYIGQAFIHDELALSLLLILIFNAPLDALDLLLNGMFAVLSKPSAIFFRKYFLGPLVELAMVAILMVMGANVRTVATGFVISTLVAISLYGYFLYQQIRKMGLLPFFHPKKIDVPAKEIFAFTIPLLTSDLVYTVMNTADAMLLGYFSTSSEVATLRAVQPTARLNQLVLGTFSMLFTPVAARMFARNDLKGISNLYWQNAVWISVASFPIFALTFSLAKPITLLLYGTRYEQSAIIMALLAFGYYFNAATGQNGMTLKVFGKLRLIVVINVGAAALNFLVNLLLIPKYGALGAAFGTFLTMVLFNLMKQIALAIQTGISFFDSSYFRVYAVIAGAALALLLIEIAFSPHPLVSIALAALASFLVFRLTYKQLNVEQTFPELLKIPLVKLLFT